MSVGTAVAGYDIILMYEVVCKTIASVKMIFECMSVIGTYRLVTGPL